MHFAVTPQPTPRRLARAGACMRALAVVAMTTAQGVVALPLRSPGKGLS